MSIKNTYPDWVEKYRGKGQTIRKVRDGYGLYKCTSVYVPGARYPKSKQEYLGMITEKGFIPKKSVSEHPSYIEFGLSHFIWSNFKRDLIRSTFNGSEYVARMGVVYYIFSAANESLIPLTFISDGHAGEMIRLLPATSERRIKNIAKKINQLMDEKIKDKEDRAVLEALLRCCVMDSKNLSAQTPALPEAASEIIERHGLKYGKI